MKVYRLTDPNDNPVWVNPDFITSIGILDGHTIIFLGADNLIVQESVDKAISILFGDPPVDKHVQNTGT